MTTYDLILMDCNMPIMDGYESCDKIRSLLQRLDISQPIILAVTGHTEQSYVDRALESGMNYVLSKPINADILKSILLKLNFGSQMIIERSLTKSIQENLNSGLIDMYRHQ